jgi:hypothetical protein
LNISNYKKICKISDQILLSKKSRYTTCAISKLSILKEHPELLNNFNISYKKKIKDNLIKNFCNYFLNFFVEKKNFYKFKDKKIYNNTDILILSPLINEDHLNIKNNFYFGNIEKDLKNKKTVIVYRNFTKKNSKNLFQNLKKKNKIILSTRSDIISEIKFFLLSISEFFFFKFNFKKKFQISFLEFFSIITNLRLTTQVLEVIKITNPKVVVFTFEGHAWERVLNYKIKNYDKRITTVAYQFTVTTRYQHSIFRPLKNSFNPDYILTTGSITKKKFIRCYNKKVRGVEIVGSNKLFKVNKKNVKENYILIAPEAFENETRKMLKFTIELSSKFPDKYFIFRTHPMYAKSLQISNKELPKNLIISKRGLETDLKVSRYLIFRGSAVVFQACINNIIPLYLEFEDKLNINPIFNKFPKVLNIRNITDINKIFNNEKILTYSSNLNKFCNEYFKKSDYNFLNSLQKK